jgi:3-hydroxyacyl-[acyl-carrier-protein] dehydratase
MTDDFILERIPHRPPFLWLDRVLEISGDSIRAEKVVPGTWNSFRGIIPSIP